ncbi:hypothetical protein FA95DRAFT_1496986, partial [Auriscalpium vulgare]
SAATTLADVRLELARQEASDVAGNGLLSVHETSASAFLSAGFDLEDQQRALRAKASSEDSKTAAGKVALQNKRNALRHRIAAWRAIQLVYMPVVVVLRAKAEQAAAATAAPKSPTPPLAEDEQLWLPSEVPCELWSTGLTLGLIEKATRLRQAQAEDALHDVRRHLRVRMGLIHYKHVHVDGPGQKSNTRARDSLKRFNGKLRMHVSRYRASHAALGILDPEGSWVTHLRPLREEDIRAPKGDDEDTGQEIRERLGEGHREIPWIWRVLKPDARDLPCGGADPASQEEVHESLRVQWMKGRARVRRWAEEITLLQVEMDQSIRFLLWKSDWWWCRARIQTDKSTDIVRALEAYAARQATIYSSLASTFQVQWTKSLAVHGLSISWTSPSPNHLDLSICFDSTTWEEMDVDSNAADADTGTEAGTHDDVLNIQVHDAPARPYLDAAEGVTAPARTFPLAFSLPVRSSIASDALNDTSVTVDLSDSEESDATSTKSDEEEDDFRRL